MKKETATAQSRTSTAMSKKNKRLINLSYKDILLGLLNLVLFFKYGKHAEQSWQIILLVAFELASVATTLSQLFHLDKWKNKSQTHEYTSCIISMVGAAIMCLLTMLLFILMTLIK